VPIFVPTLFQKGILSHSLWAELSAPQVILSIDPFDFRIGGHRLPSGLKRGNVAGWAGRPAHAKTYHSSGVDPKHSIY